MSVYYFKLHTQWGGADPAYRGSLTFHYEHGGAKTLSIADAGQELAEYLVPSIWYLMGGSVRPYKWTIADVSWGPGAIPLEGTPPAVAYDPSANIGPAEIAYCLSRFTSASGGPGAKWGHLFVGPVAPGAFSNQFGVPGISAAADACTALEQTIAVEVEENVWDTFAPVLWSVKDQSATPIVLYQCAEFWGVRRSRRAPWYSP